MDHSEFSGQKPIEITWAVEQCGFQVKQKPIEITWAVAVRRTDGINLS
jgi:hypothetical protein